MDTTTSGINAAGSNTDDISDTSIEIPITKPQPEAEVKQWATSGKDYVTQEQLELVIIFQKILEFNGQRGSTRLF